MIAEWMHATRRLLFRRRAEQAMDEEMRFHIELETREKVRRGMAPEEARRAALIEFGGLAQAQEEVRDAWGVRFFDNLWRDTAYGFRLLRKERGYAAVVALTLAFGIGSNTAMFSVVNQLLLSPLPYKQGDRIVVITQSNTDLRRDNIPFSHAEQAAYRAGTSRLEEIAELHNMRFTLLNRQEAEVVETGVVSANYFDLFGIQPLYGRAFVPGEDRHGADAVLVLSYRYFVKSFGGDPSIVGRSVHLNDRMHTVVGVLPPLPEYPQKIDVFMPTSSCPTRSSEQFRNNPRARLVTLYGRLKPAVSPAEARAELHIISRRLREQFPDAYAKHERWGPRASLLSDELARPAKATFLMLFAATGLVLLIACANVANLALARALKRSREMSIRGALGAGRGRIFQQLTIEGLLVSLAGGLLGVLLAGQTLGLLVRFAERFSPRAYAISVDRAALLFSLAVSVVTGVVFCALPAWRRKTDLAPSIRDGGAISAGPRRSRLRGTLVAAQVGLSFVLLIGAGLLFKSFLNLAQVDKGFQPERVVSLQVSPNWSKINDSGRFVRFYETLLDKVRAIPGVTSAAVGARVPLGQSPAFLRNFKIEHQETPDGAPRPLVDLSATSPGYFATLGVPLVAGRDFTAADREGAPLVAVINQSMARHRWPGQDPLGQRVAFDDGQHRITDDGQHWITIVGVVGDARFDGLDRDPGDQLYQAFAQSGFGTNLVIRTAVDPVSLMRDIRLAVHQLDPEQAIAALRTMPEIVSERLASPRLTTTLLGLFAALTLLVTVTGISGVAALAVSHRRAEMGIRLALGARPWQLVGMIVRQEMAMVTAGLAVGLAGALALTRLLSAFLFRTRPTDVATFAGAVTVLLAVSAAACFLPARRAAAVDPTLSLRSE